MTAKVTVSVPLRGKLEDYFNLFKDSFDTIRHKFKFFKRVADAILFFRTLYLVVIFTIRY